MKRIGIFLLLLLTWHACAQGAGPAFDETRLAAIYGEALTYVAPRILEPIPVPRLTVWGLQGLTVADPSLRLIAKDTRLQLLRNDQAMMDIAAPKDAAPDAWANVAAALTAAAAGVSPSLRKAGMQTIVQGFFDQMFARVDPYSRYVPPAEAGADRARRGGYAGLGMSVAARGQVIEVRTVVRDSPAANAGIRPGDILAAVDGQRTLDQDPLTIEALLMGPEGSSVMLSWRSRDGRTRDAALTRTLVPPETVFPRRIDDVLVVRITSFSSSTAAHMAQAVQDALAEPHPVEGIVLDLRDNRGGLLRQAVTAADAFLPAGLVATTSGRDPDAMHIWRSTEGELAENVPLVLLVDGRTASAAEIMAAALADRGLAVVVGSETTGKGMVQAIDPLPDGGELFVTWSQTIAPLGWPVQSVGVMPQVCTSLGAEAMHRQLAALSTGFQPMADAVRRSRAARVPVPATEVLEIRAPCPAAEGRPSDIDAARLLISNPAAYAAALLPPLTEAH